MGNDRKSMCMKGLVLLSAVVLFSSAEAKTKKASAPKYFLEISSGNSGGQAMARWATAVGIAHLSTALEKHRFTDSKTQAKKFGLDKYTAHFTVTKMEQTTHGASQRVRCAYSMALTDPGGRILTLLEGNSDVSMPTADAMPHDMPEAWELALSSAVTKAANDISQFMSDRSNKRLRRR